MQFCTNCGKKYPDGARFCSSCGIEQTIATLNCLKCGKTLEENEKFCSGCGTPVKAAPKVTATPATSQPKLTKEGRKIIDAGAKPNQTRTKPNTPPPSTLPPSKKKKRSFLGCLGKSLLILLVALIIGIIIIWNLPDDEKDDGLTDTNIPGIVDIESGDVSHLPKNLKESPEPIQTKAIKESESLKNSTKEVEDAFSKGDILLLKQQLTESAQIQYNDILEQIQPYMKDYAKAFEKRKLIVSTDVYKEYEFSDNSGEKYSAAFALQPDGSWKLVRF